MCTQMIIAQGRMWLEAMHGLGVQHLLFQLRGRKGKRHWTDLGPIDQAEFQQMKARGKCISGRANSITQGVEVA